MREASLPQERSERVIAALPDHFRTSHAERVLARLFPDLHINQHREFEALPRSAHQRRENASFASTP